VPVTVAEQVAVCAVVMGDGVANTATLVTKGCSPEVATVIAAVPDFVEFCVEVALIVSEPEARAVEGAV
jgi:hypothetical protein